MFKFIVIDGPGKGKEFSLKSSTAIIGRGSEAEIQVDSQSASRKHARVTLEGEKVFIQNITDKLDSFVNGKAVPRIAGQPFLLHPGDKVRICDVVLELTILPEEFRNFSTHSNWIASGPPQIIATPLPPLTPNLVDLQTRIAAERETGKKYLLGSPKFTAHQARLAALEGDASAALKLLQPIAKIQEVQIAAEPKIARPAISVDNAQEGGASNSQDAENLRLDVHVLLDVSGSMAGAPIKAALECLNSLVSKFPGGLDDFSLSLITYGTTARLEFSRVPQAKVRMPEVKAGGFSALGQALNILMDNLLNNPPHGALTKKPRAKPLIFVIGDCQGTDELNTQFSALRPVCSLFLCVLGQRMPDQALLDMCDEAICGRTASDFGSVCDWISAVLRQRLKGGNVRVAATAPLITVPRNAR